jgi:hypothetical protein
VSGRLRGRPEHEKVNERARERRERLLEVVVWQVKWRQSQEFARFPQPLDVVRVQVDELALRDRTGPRLRPRLVEEQNWRLPGGDPSVNLALHIALPSLL